MEEEQSDLLCKRRRCYIVWMDLPFCVIRHVLSFHVIQVEMSKSIISQQQQVSSKDQHWLRLFYGYFKRDHSKSIYQLFEHATILWPVLCPQTICYLYRILAERNFIHLCTLCKSLDIHFIASCKSQQMEHQSVKNVLELLHHVTLDQQQPNTDAIHSHFRITSLCLFSEMKNLATPILAEDKIVSILLQTPLQRFQHYSAYTKIQHFLPLFQKVHSIDFIPNESSDIHQYEFSISPLCKRTHLQQMKNLKFALISEQEIQLEELCLEQCKVIDLIPLLEKCIHLRTIELNQCQFDNTSLEQLQQLLLNQYSLLKDIRIDSCIFQPCTIHYDGFSSRHAKSQHMESVFIMNNTTVSNANQLICTNFAVNYLNDSINWPRLKYFSCTLSNITPIVKEPCIMKRQFIIIAKLVQQMLLENRTIGVIWLDQLDIASMPVDFCCKIVPFCKYFAAFDVKRNRIFLQKEPLV